jgi:arylsulfatase
VVNGVAQRPIEGVSMAYSFDAANAQAPTRRRTQHFEMFGHRGIYHDGWYANTTPPNPPWDSAGQPPADVVNGYAWELYNLAEDPTQSLNLAAQHPDRLRNLQQLFLVEATRFGVLPMANSTLDRLLVQRPGFSAGRTEFTYSGTGVGLTSDSSPPILNRAYRVTAEIEVPAGGANGMLATQGGRFGGYGFYLREGRPVWTWNFLDIERVKWEGTAALPPGRHTVTFAFQPDAAGPPVGRGGVGTLSVNGQRVAERRMERTIPFYMQWDEPFDVGQDTGTPVDDRDYQVPFAFTGALRSVQFNLGASTLPQAAARN